MSNKPTTHVAFADAQQFGEIIRQQRKKIGLRIDDAAALCGVSVHSFPGWRMATAQWACPRLCRLRNSLVFPCTPNPD
ncbi:MAG: hypothetical protein ACOH1I_07355 [Gallionellaceae bacterium]